MEKLVVCGLEAARQEVVREGKPGIYMYLHHIFINEKDCGMSIVPSIPQLLIVVVAQRQ